MSKIDWHAYLDGSMTPSERAEAERALLEDATARIQLENLRAFLAQIAAEGQAEEVPSARLQAMLKASTATKPPFRTWRPVMVAAFATVVVVAFLARPAPPLPEFEKISVTDRVVAEGWIQERTGIVASIPALASGVLVGTERTDDEGCFCFMVNGHLVHLVVSQKAGFPKGLRLKDGFTVSEAGVGFRTRGLIWFVHGEVEKDVWLVAREARAKMAS